jgi:hypothetical protein
MIVPRVIEPAAKLATARQLSDATASHALGALLGLGEVDADELYEALDRLQAAQPEIEQALARRHLKDGVLVLYDVSSSYLEGEHCELAQRGYSRDHRPDRPQIVYGLLCNEQGCPVAVEGVRRQYGRSDDARGPDHQAANTLQPQPHRAGRRPRPDHRRAA